MCHAELANALGLYQGRWPAASSLIGILQRSQALSDAPPALSGSGALRVCLVCLVCRYISSKNTLPQHFELTFTKHQQMW